MADSATQTQVYIVGPKRLQNELIGDFLKRKLAGVEYRLFDDLRSTILTDACKTRRSLVLCDCDGKEIDDLLRWPELTVCIKTPRCLVTLFNLPADNGSERKLVHHGVRGVFFAKDEIKRFSKGIQSVLKGELWYPREVLTRCIMDGDGFGAGSGEEIPNLTRREREILLHIAMGLSNSQIADDLCISPHTVKAHVYKIFKKIDVPNRVQATMWAGRNLRR